MRLAALIIAVVICTLLPTIGYAQVDFVFLDIGPNGQRVEPGALDISGIGSGTNNTNNSYVGLVADTGDMFDLSITNNNTAGVATGGIDWRDRGNGSTDSLVRLGEDFVKNNAGFIELTFSGLPAGLYTATSYHVDPDFDQAEDIHVFITDALGTDVDAGQVGDADFSAGGAGGLTTAEVAGSSIMDFSFFSDGVNDVILVFDGATNSGDNETPLNGLFLQFQAVPEPASVAIWSLIGLGLVGFGYRRFRCDAK